MTTDEQDGSAMGEHKNKGYPKGLYKKYRVLQADGKPLPPEAVVFVMRVDKDPAARMALQTYAAVTPNDELAADLYQVLSALFFHESHKRIQQQGTQTVVE